MPESVKRVREHGTMPVRITACAIVAAMCVIFAYGLSTMTLNIAAMAGVIGEVTPMGTPMLITLGLVWSFGTAYLMVPSRKRGTGGDTAAARVRS